MTSQYEQSDINLRDASPISITTPGPAPVLIQLDVFTADGQSLAVDLYGGGSDPALSNTNNYVVSTGVALFSREAGVGAVQPVAAILAVVGVGSFIGFLVDDVTIPGSTICLLSITGAPFPYTHRLKISKVRF